MSFSPIFKNDLKTIFAPGGPMIFSAVSILRISGSEAKKVFNILKTGIKTEDLLERKAYFAKIFDEANELLDSCLMIFFQGPKSFTGEDVVEIQTHGSPLITKLLCEILSKQENFLHAEHGEFSRRALKNGKIDLVQAEGLLKLIHSQTKSQLKLANKELSGEISQIFKNLRESIIENLSIIEALIDFPEDDLDGNEFFESQNKNFQRKINAIEWQIKKNLEKLIAEIKEFLCDGHINEKITEGFEILIFGKPNSGKSSLLNYICGEEIAIVSELPGTTRDLLEKRIDLDGYLVKILDSAGIRDIENEENQKIFKTEIEKSHLKIEKMGIEKAMKSFEKSDLILILIDSNEFTDNHQNIFFSSNGLKNENIIKEKIKQKRALFVLTKMDNNSCENEIESKFFINEKIVDFIPISSLKKKGLMLLKSKILEKILEFFPSFPPVVGSSRQRQILKEIFDILKFLIENFENFEYIEIISEEIRKIALLSASLTEVVSNEEILDSLFRKFCIGK